MRFISQIHPSGGGEAINLRPQAPPLRFSDPDLADLNGLASGPCALFEPLAGLRRLTTTRGVTFR